MKAVLCASLIASAAAFAPASTGGMLLVRLIDRLVLLKGFRGHDGCEEIHLVIISSQMNPSEGRCC